MREALGPADRLYLTRSAAELDAIADRCAEDDVPVIALSGGDGTNHVTITRIAQAYGSRPLPRFALLGGGTMNIVAWSIGVSGQPERLLAQWLAADADALALVRRTVMRVDGGDQPQYGFLFGNGVIARFLEVYYRRSNPTPAHAALDLGRGVLSTLVGGPFSRALLRRWSGALTVDGARWAGDDFLAVAAGTVEQMGLGFAPFAGVGERPDALRVHAVGSGMFGLARELPRVYLGRDLVASGNRSSFAGALTLESNESGSTFMIDGDFHRAGPTLTLRPSTPVRFLGR